VKGACGAPNSCGSVLSARIVLGGGSTACCDVYGCSVRFPSLMTTRPDSLTLYCLFLPCSTIVDFLGSGIGSRNHKSSVTSEEEDNDEYDDLDDELDPPGLGGLTPPASMDEAARSNSSSNLNSNPPTLAQAGEMLSQSSQGAGPGRDSKRKSIMAFLMGSDPDVAVTASGGEGPGLPGGSISSSSWWQGTQPEMSIDVAASEEEGGQAPSHSQMASKDSIHEMVHSNRSRDSRSSWGLSPPTSPTDAAALGGSDASQMPSLGGGRLFAHVVGRIRSSITGAPTGRPVTPQVGWRVWMQTVVFELCSMAGRVMRGSIGWTTVPVIGCMRGTVAHEPNVRWGLTRPLCSHPPPRPPPPRPRRWT
jgi:hypothetical protein